MVTSFDKNGSLRTSIVSRATSELKPEDYQEIQVGRLRLRQQVDVPVQAASMRLGVQDVGDELLWAKPHAAKPAAPVELVQ